jgi:hypothetical protein
VLEPRNLAEWGARLASLRPVAIGGVVLSPGGAAAIEAAHVLWERRRPIASFLLRKAGEAAAGPAYWQGRKHPRAAGGREWVQVDPIGGGGGGGGTSGLLRWVGRYPPPYGPPDQLHRWPAVGFSPEEVPARAAEIEGQLVR